MLETNAMLRKNAIENKLFVTVDDVEYKNIQKILKDMLVDFSSVCKSADIPYFACGGTALGAIREKGFIAWDDDADVCLPRKDYDRFFKLFLQKFGDKYNVQSLLHNDKYDLTFAKIRKKNTKLVEVFDTDPDTSGIFIDVYAISNTPDNAFLRFFHGMISDFLFLCCSCVRMKNKKMIFKKYLNDKKAKRLVNFKIFLGYLLGFFTIQKWCKIADAWAGICKNENSMYVTFPDGRKHYFGELCKRDSFYPAKFMPFEDIKLSIMSKPEEYLKGLYGDYMTVPDKNMREHHSIIEIDFGENND